MKDNFINGRTLDETCALLKYNHMNVRKTEKDLGVGRGALTCRIKSKKYLPYFQQRFPKHYPPTTQIVGTEHNDMGFVLIKCQYKGCENMVSVSCLPGENLPRGLKKWCAYHREWANEQTAGCFSIEAGSGSMNEQMGTW